MYKENDNGVCDIPITGEIVMKKTGQVSRHSTGQSMHLT